MDLNVVKKTINEKKKIALITVILRYNVIVKIKRFEMTTIYRRGIIKRLVYIMVFKWCLLTKLFKRVPTPL